MSCWARRRGSAPRVETRRMARRRTKRVLKPRAPSRVRKAKRAKTKTPRGHQHPELLGLALVAFGLFLAAVLWAGWNGGYVGGWIGDAFEALVGGLAFVLPLALVVVGGLMVGRSDLVDVRPFRTGLFVFALGLLLTLGSEGGYLGSALGDALGFALGGTGVAIVGVLCLLAGALLLTGASAGALLRRGATAARRPLERPQREQLEPISPELISTAHAAAPVPLVDAASDYPDVIGQAEPAPLIPFPEPGPEETPEPDHESLFNASPAVDDYKLPDRSLLRSSGTNNAAPAEASGQVAHALVQALADFGVEASIIGQIVGPRVTRYELQLAPGTKMSQGLRAQGRPLLRARDDRDPHPRADPGQAGRRRRGPEPDPEPRHARRHLRRPPADREPASPSGSARTSPETPSGPTSPGCRTS